MPSEASRKMAQGWCQERVNDPPGVRFVSGPIIVTVEDLAALLDQRAEAERERIREVVRSSQWYLHPTGKLALEETLRRLSARAEAGGGERHE